VTSYPLSLKSISALVSACELPPPSALSYMLSRGATEAQIAALGVRYSAKQPSTAPIADYRLKGWLRKNPLRLVDALVLPLHHLDETLLGFNTRGLSHKVYDKYLVNTYKEPFFFGAPLAAQAIWESKKVLLVEGPFDFFPVQRLCPHTLALTTARLSQAQINYLSFFVKEVYTLFDSDEAGDIGRKNAYFGFKPYGIPVRHLKLPQASKDPGAFYESHGIDMLGRWLKNQIQQ